MKTKYLSGRCLLPVIACSALLGVAASSHAQAAFTFYTLAGSVGQGSANGSGTNALFHLPAGVVLDGSGSVYVSDSANNTIRKITSGGTVSTFAGTPGVAGSLNGLGNTALFNQPAGLGIDAAGNLYVADSGNSLIRKITSAGQVSTLAGSAGITGNLNATGTNATFSHPQGVAVDPSTNVYVADYGNNLIRKITPAGVVTTFAGSATTFGNVDATGTNAAFYQPEGIAIDSGLNLYVADTADNTIRKITSSGIVTTIAGSSTNFGSSNGVSTNALFYQPAAVVVDSALNVYVADYFNNTIRKITSGGTVTTLAGSPGVSGSADGLTNNARFWGPTALALDGSGTLYVADYFNNAVRKVTSVGAVTTFAGTESTGTNDGLSTFARFNTPLGGAVDGSGNIFVADAANHTIRKISRTGVVTTFAGTPGKSGSMDGSGTNALFNGPQAVAVDAANNVYVADTLNSTIRKVTSSGAVTTLAGGAGTNNSFDGTNGVAAFNRPGGIAVDAGGSIYVADTFNSAIRKVTPAGVVTTLAGLAGNTGTFDGTNTVARFNFPRGISVDSSTNIFVADTLNHTVREVSKFGTNWVTSTIAGLPSIAGTNDGMGIGGTGTNGISVAATFNQPGALAVDLADNIYVVDTGNYTVREIVPAVTNWLVSTTAGLPGISGSTDGTGTNVLFFNPGGIALDNFGYLYVIDTENNTIRTDNTIILPLVIQGLSVTVRPTSAILTFLTSQLANAQIQYGLTPSYGITVTDTNIQASHGFLLTGLQTNQAYYYQITSTNTVGNYSVTGSFTTYVDIIMQSSDAVYSGVWVNDTSGPDRYSSIYKFASTTNSDTADALFRPTILTYGNYDVSMWYSEGTNRSTLAPVTISYNGGSTQDYINETLPGGQWTPLVSGAPMLAGTNGFVRLGNFTGETNAIVISDAVRFVYVLSQDQPTTNGGLPAFWTTFYFGTTNVNSASLGANGLSLLSDFILGLSPIDPNAQLGLKLAPLAGGGFTATFTPWQSSRLYTLYSTTNLTHPTWTPVSGLTLNVTNNVGTFANTNAVTGPATFYRLGVQVSQ